MTTKTKTLPLRKLPPRLLLKSGAHEPDGEYCVMELVAYVANEPWSDHPVCACPVISTFLRSWNDSLPTDEDRTRLLKPLVKKVIGTKATAEVELARVMLCIDWACREWLPTWLDLVPALQEQATILRGAKPIQSARLAFVGFLGLQNSAVKLVERMCAVK